MKHAAALLLLLLAASCRSEPHWSNVESGMERWQLERPTGETSVSPVLAYPDLAGYIDGKRGEGWAVARIDAAGPEFPSCYLVTFRR